MYIYGSIAPLSRIRCRPAGCFSSFRSRPVAVKSRKMGVCTASYPFFYHKIECQFVPVVAKSNVSSWRWFAALSGSQAAGWVLVCCRFCWCVLIPPASPAGLFCRVRQGVYTLLSVLFLRLSSVCSLCAPFRVRFGLSPAPPALCLPDHSGVK